MGGNRITQQRIQRHHQRRSPNRLPPTPASVDRQTRIRLGNPELWLRLWVRHGWTLVFGVWAVGIITATVATIDMVTIDPQTPTPPSIASPTTSTVSPSPADAVPPFEPSAPQISHESSSESLPLQSIAVLVLACVIGCLVISLRLKPRQPKKRLQFSTSSRKAKERSISSAAGSTSSGQSTTISRSTTLSNAKRTTNEIPAPPVAIVPATESHPLDWDEPSLADNLDIRQRRPLSYWLKS